MLAQPHVPDARRAWLKAADDFEASLKALSRILRDEAKYRPDQPRAPRGTPIGGQWIDDPSTDRGPLRLPLSRPPSNTGIEEVRIAPDERALVMGLGAAIRPQMSDLPQSFRRPRSLSE